MRNRADGFPKYLKICSEKQAFDLWIDVPPLNGRIMGELFEMFGENSKHYKEWCERERKLK